MALENKAVANHTNSYQQTELQHIKADATLEGWKAHVQSLERDLQRLNGLPQILPILQYVMILESVTDKPTYKVGD